MFYPELSTILGANPVYASVGAAISLTEAHILQFDFMGSESGYADTFSAAGMSYTEGTAHDPGENHFPGGTPLWSAYFAAGDLAGLLNFSTSDPLGSAATVGEQGFAIFLPSLFESGTSLQNGDSFYIGYDDYITGDDNHDDFLVKVTLLPAVPEPSTWLLMILGFGAIGYGMRQRKQTERIRFNFA
ncbi:MAG TPA: PEPxxWA-CTERM sorting domain-containing protein [Croceibacterium sp.]|nr:PEPxxWA-CTERM sorting domain-containing protein [Croceibacterium sp.]